MNFLNVHVEILLDLETNALASSTFILVYWNIKYCQNIL